MSMVTGVMLICSEIGDSDDDPPPQIREIQAWLVERYGPVSLKELSDGAGGSKHPQFEAWCGGFNYFASHEDDFAEFVLTREWSFPENLVLILQPEDGPTRVFRPEG